METTMTRTNWGRAFGGGIVAGIVAGLVLAAYLVGMNVVDGKDIWLPLKGAGVPLIGDRATQPGFDLNAILVGAGAHFGISIIWGLLFAMLFKGASKLGTVTLGAVWGIAVWLVMYYLVLPLAGMAHLTKMVPVGQAVLTHVIFGLILGLAFLPFQRPRGQREPTLPDRLEPST